MESVLARLLPSDSRGIPGVAVAAPVAAEVDERREPRPVGVVFLAAGDEFSHPGRVCGDRAGGRAPEGYNGVQSTPPDQLSRPESLQERAVAGGQRRADLRFYSVQLRVGGRRGIEIRATADDTNPIKQAL